MERPWLVNKLQGLGAQTYRGSFGAFALGLYNVYRGQAQVAQWYFVAGAAMVPLAFVLAGLEYCCQRLDAISPSPTKTDR